MAGSVVFQSATPATPPAATEIAADRKPLAGGAGGSAYYQWVQLDVGPTGTTVPVTWGGTGMPIGTVPGGTVALGGTAQALGTVAVRAVYNSTLPTLSSGALGDLQLTSRGELVMAAQDVVSTPNNINAADAASTVTTGEDGQSIITGNPTNNSTVSASGSGNSSFAVLISGTWVGTLQFERSLDNGTTWTPVAAFSAGTAYNQSTVTGNGAFHGNASAATNIRVRATAWTSGVASVRILLGAGTGTVTVGNPIRLVDSSFGTVAAIRGGAVAAGDAALVVAERPATGYGGTAFTATSAGTTVLLPQAAGTRWRVTSEFISANGSVNATWLSMGGGGTTGISGTFFSAVAGNGLVRPAAPAGRWYYQTQAGSALGFFLSLGTATSVDITYEVG